MTKSHITKASDTCHTAPTLISVTPNVHVQLVICFCGNLEALSHICVNPMVKKLMLFVCKGTTTLYWRRWHMLTAADLARLQA